MRALRAYSLEFISYYFKDYIYIYNSFSKMIISYEKN